MGLAEKEADMRRMGNVEPNARASEGKGDSGAQGGKHQYRNFGGAESYPPRRLDLSCSFATSYLVTGRQPSMRRSDCV